MLDREQNIHTMLGRMNASNGARRFDGYKHEYRLSGEGNVCPKVRPLAQVYSQCIATGAQDQICKVRNFDWVLGIESLGESPVHPACIKGFVESLGDCLRPSTALHTTPR